MDVRVRRGADIASNHYLVVGIRIKIAKYKSNQDVQRKKKFAVEKLKDPDFRTTYVNKVERSIGEIADPQQYDIKGKWDMLRKVICASAETTIGFKEHEKAEWISADTWNLVNRRRKRKQLVLNAKTPNAREIAGRDYRQLNKQVKRSARKDKKK